MGHLKLVAATRAVFWPARKLRSAFWRGVPARARVLFLAGVFSTFSVVGFVADIMSLGANPPHNLVFLVLSSGLVAVVYAVCAFQNARLLIIVVALHATATLLMPLERSAVSTAIVDAAARDALHARLFFDGIGCMVAMVLGYTFFVTFISTEGQRYLRVHTEMVLAERIHRSLVPTLTMRVPGATVFGESFPSGEVGGDLVDVVDTPQGWVAIVADVSGHGVRSGVLTAMTKSAVRMRLRAAADLPGLLADLNDTLIPMIERNMFVTCACLRRTADGVLSIAAAGHPPILHWRRATGEVVEHASTDLALAMFERREYQARRLEADPGDVLLLLTDGLMEVFDRRDEEFGLPGVVRVFRERATDPLPLLAEAIRTASAAHGAQTDDQTLLLIRVE